MRKLHAIVRISLCIVRNARQDRSLRSTIALQFVGDDPERFLALPSHQSANEPLGGILIATRLQQNIDDITVLIHGTPEILQLTIDFHEDFVQMPGITQASLLLFETLCIVRTKFPAPSSNGFVRHSNAALGQKIFHIAEAQAEAMIDPNSVADDFRREAVSAVTRPGALHGFCQLAAQIDNTNERADRRGR